MRTQEELTEDIAIAMLGRYRDFMPTKLQLCEIADLAEHTAGYIFAQRNKKFAPVEPPSALCTGNHVLNGPTDKGEYFMRCTATMTKHGPMADIAAANRWYKEHTGHDPQ